jgi:dihydrofolate reductase
MISIIVAVSEDLGIGKGNKLLWHISEDMKRFKRLTLGNTLIMGKKTWESLPVKPLPLRKNIVLTDDLHETFDHAVTAYSIEEAIGKCKKEDEIFIIGGGSVYSQFLPLTDRLYITKVHKTAPADVYFPEIDPKIWEVVKKEDFNAAENGGISYSYLIFERKKLNQQL